MPQQHHHHHHHNQQQHQQLQQLQQQNSISVKSKQQSPLFQQQQQQEQQQQQGRKVSSLRAVSSSTVAITAGNDSAASIFLPCSQSRHFNSRLVFKPKSFAASSTTKMKDAETRESSSAGNDSYASGTDGESPSLVVSSQLSSLAGDGNQSVNEDYKSDPMLDSMTDPTIDHDKDSGSNPPSISIAPLTDTQSVSRPFAMAGGGSTSGVRGFDSALPSPSGKMGSNVDNSTVANHAVTNGFSGDRGINGRNGSVTFGINSVNTTDGNCDIGSQTTATSAAPMKPFVYSLSMNGAEDTRLLFAKQVEDTRASTLGGNQGLLSQTTNKEFSPNAQHSISKEVFSSESLLDDIATADYYNENCNKLGDVIEAFDEEGVTDAETESTVVEEDSRDKAVNVKRANGKHGKDRRNDDQQQNEGFSLTDDNKDQKTKSDTTCRFGEQDNVVDDDDDDDDDEDDHDVDDDNNENDVDNDNDDNDDDEVEEDDDENENDDEDDHDDDDDEASEQVNPREVQDLHSQPNFHQDQQPLPLFDERHHLRHLHQPHHHHHHS